MSNVLNYSGSSKMDRNVADSMSSLLQDELDGIAGMDIPFNSSDFMSSDFFDSVLSMERENALDGVLENNYDYDLNMSDSGTTNSHIESVHSPSTTSSDSDQYLQCTENNGITLFGSDDNSEIIDSSDLLPFFKNKELSPVFPTIPPNQMIIRRQNRQSNKKVLVTNPINIKSNNKNAVSKSQVIRVQSISGNGRSLLLPVNVKKIKIVNANSLKMENLKVIPSNQQQVLRKMHVEKYAASSSSAESVDDLDELDIETNNMRGDRSYPPLELNSEERRLLYKEGIKLPTHYPLTKHEEKELKRIRRKIRNKISAQDSRKRKKEYVDKLEEKAKRTCEENECLKKRIKMLRKQNGKLMEQMRKLQEVLFRTSSSKATPTTCLMIVLFSTLLVCLPNMRTASEKKDLEIGEQHLVAARRALLFNQKGSPEEDTINMDDFLVFNRDEESELESFEEADSVENGTNGGDNSGFKHFLGELARKYEALAATDGNNGGGGAGLRAKLPEFEPELLRRCVETSNGGDVTKSKPNGSLLEFCTKYEDEIRGMVDNMRTILQQEEPLTPPASDEEEAVVDHQFIEPDISDDEYSVTEEYDGDGGKEMMSNSYLWDDDDPPTKRRRMTSGELVEQRHHAVETVSPLLEATRRYNAKKQ